ncbi:MAG: ABC transporter ATP-binding protein [Candidatus Zixiibacteriota bacterium]
MSIVEVNNLTKTYGSLKAVDDFSFTADKGEIVALVGPDGAGKTSTFRATCNLISYDAGGIKIAGYNASQEFEKIKPLLGYMPQTFSLYPDLSVEENLYFYAGLFGLNRQQFNQKEKLLYEFSGLGPFHNRRAGALSGGMKQKLALSCALIHDPKVLILDEPTTGVDPLSRSQFWNILKSLRDGGSTIVVSTPYMDEVALSNRAIFIYKGRKLVEGTPRQLIQKFAGKVYRASVSPTSERMDQLNKIRDVASRRFGSSVHIYIPQNHSIEDYHDDLHLIGIEPNLIEPVQPGLEDTFIQFTGKYEI